MATLYDNPANLAMLALGTGMMEAGGPTQQPMSIGQALGTGMDRAMQMYQTAMQGQIQMQELQYQREERERANEAWESVGQKLTGENVSMMDIAKQMLGSRHTAPYGAQLLATSIKAAPDPMEQLNLQLYKEGLAKQRKINEIRAGLPGMEGEKKRLAEAQLAYLEAGGTVDTLDQVVLPPESPGLFANFTKLFGAGDQAPPAGQPPAARPPAQAAQPAYALPRNLRTNLQRMMYFHDQDFSPERIKNMSREDAAQVLNVLQNTTLITSKERRERDAAIKRLEDKLWQ